MALRKRVRGRRRALRDGSVLASSSAPAPPASSIPSSPTARAIRQAARCRRAFATPGPTTPSRSPPSHSALGLAGPAVVISSACSSSAKVFASAQRALAAGVIDAALVGGVDSLCLTTLYGFHSLQLVSSTPCRPFDAARNGISIGEAAAFALLERAGGAPRRRRGAAARQRRIKRRPPHVRPAPAGPRRALPRCAQALAAAGVGAPDIDYINFHGTGTPSNDEAEAQRGGGGARGSGVPAAPPRAPPVTRSARPVRSRR